MAAYDGHRVKDRSAKVARRRQQMPVNGRGVFAVQAVIAKRGRAGLECMGCRRGDDSFHRHDPAEDGPRSGCCLHVCGR